jgi:type I restriction enzyme S subunit
MSKTNWKEKKLKFLFEKRIGGSWGDEPVEGNSIVCIRAADFETEKLKHKQTDLTRRSYKEEELVNKELQEGDIIIEKSGGGENQPVGRVVLFSLNERALCSNFLEVLRPKKKIVVPRFAAYLLYSLWNNRITTTAIKQTTGIQNLDISEYLDFKVPLPEIEQQIKIVKFLDYEILYLDNLTATKQNYLKVLAEKKQAFITHVMTSGAKFDTKTKNSNIDWLGNIPEHWQIKKIKYITKKIGSGVTPKGGAEVYQNEGIRLFRSQNIHFEGLMLDDVAYISEEIHQAMINSRVENGDVLLNITGASIGRCYYYEGQFEEANVNQHVCIIRPNERLITQYLFYFFYSDLGQNQILFNQVGGGREGLNFENIKSFIIPLPSTEEQKQLVEFIRGTINKLNKLESKTIQSLNLLKERKSALISEAIFGK